MKKHALLAMVLIGVVSIGTENVGAQPNKKQPFEPKFGGALQKAEPRTTAKWEYRAMTYGQLLGTEMEGLEAGLNKLGSDGWELVAIDSPGGAKTNRDSMYVFRRAATGKPKADQKPVPEPGPTPKDEPRSELRIYHLKNANANDMTAIISDVLRQTKQSLRVAADPRTNQVVVNATEDVQNEIAALLQRLDVPADNRPPDPNAPGVRPPNFFGKKKSS